MKNNKDLIIKLYNKKKTHIIKQYCSDFIFLKTICNDIPFLYKTGICKTDFLLNELKYYSMLFVPELKEGFSINDNNPCAGTGYRTIKSSETGDNVYPIGLGIKSLMLYQRKLNNKQ